MKLNLIMAICPTDKHQEAVHAAKAAGATGATLLSARGTGVKEAKTFFGLTLDKLQEAIIILAEDSQSPKIMKAIYDSADMEKPGNGICFSVDVERFMGLESQMTVLKKEHENNL